MCRNRQKYRTAGIVEKIGISQILDNALFSLAWDTKILIDILLSPPKESIHFCRAEYSKLRGAMAR